MEYKIVEKFSKVGLEQTINRLLTEGWKLQGSPSYTESGYLQAMVREE